MKVLLCLECNDIVALSRTHRQCECGGAGGHYLRNEVDAIIYGEKVIPIGFEAHSYTMALISQPETGLGREFTAFVIPKHTRSIERISKDQYVSKLANSVFRDASKAQGWLATPTDALNGYTPMERLNSGEGTEELISLLRRLETGELS
jgi:hypothetical protein